MKKILAGYVPVLHKGYLDLFRAHADAERLCLFGPEMIAQFRSLQKDIRGIDPSFMRQIILATGMFKRVEVATPDSLRSACENSEKIVMPDEDVSRAVADEHLAGYPIDYESIFLRWDAKNSTAKVDVSPDDIVSETEFDRSIMCYAKIRSQKSSDWWRHVGAVAVRDGQILFVAHNTHVPSELSPYSEGDPRASFTKGVNIDLSTAMHAEEMIMALALQEGTSMKGVNLYVTTFPCPVCAKLIAYSGIRTCYFASGYAMLDGERIMKARGVKIIRVIT